VLLLLHECCAQRSCASGLLLCACIAPEKLLDWAPRTGDCRLAGQCEAGGPRNLVRDAPLLESDAAVLRRTRAEHWSLFTWSSGREERALKFDLTPPHGKRRFGST